VHQNTPMPQELKGNFFPPTLIVGCDPKDTLDEIFGPVATVHPFSSEEEALKLANQTPFGLSGYCFGSDERGSSSFLHFHVSFIADY